MVAGTLLGPAVEEFVYPHLTEGIFAVFSPFKLGSLADFMSELDSYTFQIASASQMPIFGKSKGLVETARAAADQLSGGPADIKRQLAAGDLPANLRENRHLAVM